MCNLYSVTKGQQAIRELYRAMVDRTGNMPPLPGIFPDQMAPVVRSGGAGRELVMMRWGFPCPPSVPGNRAVTNIRNTASNYWRAWMKPENRCLVPATSFCEYAPGKPAVPHWFALGEDRPIGRCSPSRACGGPGAGREAPRQTPPTANMSCSLS